MKKVAFNRKYGICLVVLSLLLLVVSGSLIIEKTKGFPLKKVHLLLNQYDFQYSEEVQEKLSDLFDGWRPNPVIYARIKLKNADGKFEEVFLHGETEDQEFYIKSPKLFKDRMEHDLFEIRLWSPINYNKFLTLCSFATIFISVAFLYCLDKFIGIKFKHTPRRTLSLALLSICLFSCIASGAAFLFINEATPNFYPILSLQDPAPLSKEIQKKLTREAAQLRFIPVSGAAIYLKDEGNQDAITPVFTYGNTTENFPETEDTTVGSRWVIQYSYAFTIEDFKTTCFYLVTIFFASSAIFLFLYTDKKSAAI